MTLKPQTTAGRIVASLLHDGGWRTLPTELWPDVPSAIAAIESETTTAERERIVKVIGRFKNEHGWVTVRTALRIIEGQEFCSPECDAPMHGQAVANGSKRASNP